MHRARRYFLFCICFFILSCATKEDGAKTDSIPAHPVKSKIASVLPHDSVGKKKHDTIFKIADFLVEGYDGLVLEVSDNRHPVPFEKMKSKGDTLYSDSRYTLLGNFDEVSNRIVYLKYPKAAKFEQHPVDSVYRGILAKPDFKTDRKALWYVTMVKSECRTEGVNFAGHYTLATIGCGCPCQVIVVIDRITGRIYFSSLPKMMKEGVANEDFRADSRLVRINIGLDDEHPGYYSCFYEWRDSVFVKAR